MDAMMDVASSTNSLEVEVLAKAKRRRFTLEYKRRILREADRCRKSGEGGFERRIISARQSNRQERRAYDQAIEAN